MGIVLPRRDPSKSFGSKLNMPMAGRHSSILAILLLSACSPNTPSPLETAYVPPSPPTEKAIASAVAALAGEAKLVKPVEISSVRPNDHGPGRYFVCVREVNPPLDSDKPRRYYAVFLNNDEYRGARLSVIMDHCELQSYSSVSDAPPATLTAPPLVNGQRTPGLPGYGLQ
jgi:hypothetical protein